LKDDFAGWESFDDIGNITDVNLGVNFFADKPKWFVG
jgi:hypothetical protein